MKLLLVEDDIEAGDYLLGSLDQAGHAVDWAKDGEAGLRLASQNSYDVMILDRMLPALGGLEVLRTLRGEENPTPVLLLTAVDGILDRVEGLEAGADDYLVKPFAFVELLARLNALARRPPPQAATSLQVADLRIDLIKRTVSRAGAPIELQRREFQLLEFLMRQPGRVATRTMLLEGIWGYNFDPQTNIVDTHMSRLRGKVDRGFSVELIRTVRGSGYVMREPE